MYRTLTNVQEKKKKKVAFQVNGPRLINLVQYGRWFDSLVLQGIFPSESTVSADFLSVSGGRCHQHLCLC